MTNFGVRKVCVSFELGRRLSEKIEKAIVADDHPIFCRGLRRIVQKITGCTVLEAANKEELLVLASSETEPDLMLLDFIFPGFNGVASIAEMRLRFPRTIIIIVSMSDDQNLVSEIMKTGVNGFISKSVPASDLEDSVRSILEGDVIARTAVSEINVDPDGGHSANLPKRQLDVLLGMAKGQSNKEIARELGISPYTVRDHVSAVFRALDVNNRSAAISAAVDAGII
ncbi:MAG: DNA-binding NarL/FixJ family response regulator [Maritalea sp.]